MRNNDSTLSDKTVWVTRPAPQATDLCRMIRARQGVPVSLPTLVIAPVTAEVRTAANRRQLAIAEIVIFISRNAAAYAWECFPGIADTLRDKSVLAVGQATARYVATRGLRQVEYVQSGGSDALLQLPVLGATKISNKRVIIVRGQGGREELRERLFARGAKVDYLEVYRRDKPQITPADVVKFWHDQRPDAVIITSLTGLENFIELTPPAARGHLFETAMVVMSERIRQHALAAGFTHIATATDNTDAGLVDALVNMNGDAIK